MLMPGAHHLHNSCETEIILKFFWSIIHSLFFLSADEHLESWQVQDSYKVIGTYDGKGYLWFLGLFDQNRV